MIRVTPQAEYPEFENDVRTPGLSFLTRTPSPTSKQFKRKNYWSKAADTLHSGYSGLCAYSSRYLVHTGSVDHFLPKDQFPHLAYEWDNYRLASQTMNSRKSNSLDVIDPFKIGDGWFVLDLPSCLIKPNPILEVDDKRLVVSTIDILQLNNDDRLVQERCDFLVALASKEITLTFLDSQFPYISTEVRRQNVLDQLPHLFLASTT
jgi:hypothetical protein